MRKIGILGGTFDPIHTGHLQMARHALECGWVDAVFLTPAEKHPAKKQPAASFSDRVNMCALAAADEENISVCTLDQGENAGIADSLLDKLRLQYPQDTFVFLLGEDHLPSLPKWKNAERLFSKCEFICFRRFGDSFIERKREESLQSARAAGANIVLTENTAYPCASADIRGALLQLADPDTLPLSVLKYIGKSGLYWGRQFSSVASMMSPARYRHTQGVQETAVRLATIHHVPILKCAAAALLHDCAKDLPQEKMRKIYLKEHLGESQESMLSPALMHGPVGAFLAQKEFSVTDTDILSAIYCHTTGKENMSDIDLVIFVADAIEPGRAHYNGLDEIRKLALISLRLAALKSLYETRKHLAAGKKSFNQKGALTIADLEKKCSPDELALLQRVENHQSKKKMKEKKT